MPTRLPRGLGKEQRTTKPLGEIAVGVGELECRVHAQPLGAGSNLGKEEEMLQSLNRAFDVLDYINNRDKKHHIRSYNL